jgi:hypothetical protein
MSGCCSLSNSYISVLTSVACSSLLAAPYGADPTVYLEVQPSLQTFTDPYVSACIPLVMCIGERGLRPVMQRVSTKVDRGSNAQD